MKVVIVLWYLFAFQGLSNFVLFGDALNLKCTPEWFEEIPEGDFDFGYSVGLESSRDYNLAVTAAKRRAQVEVAATMQTYLAGVTETLYTETKTADSPDVDFTDLFLDMQKAVVRSKISGVTVQKQKVCEDEETGRFAAYVLVRYPRLTMVKQLISDVEADSMLNEFFAGKPTFEELKNKSNEN